MTAILVLILRLALAIALYAFLGWILATLWRDIKQQGEILSSQKKPGIQVRARLDNGREIQHRFSQSEVTLGRDPNCDFPILDDAVSAHHVRLAYHHSQWWLEDLMSTNGIFMGKARVMVPTVLISGDEFRCGNTLITVEMDAVNEKLDL